MCVKGASVCCCVQLSAGQVCVLKVPVCVVVFSLQVCVLKVPVCVVVFSLQVCVFKVPVCVVVFSLLRVQGSSVPAGSEVDGRLHL